LSHNEFAQAEPVTHPDLRKVHCHWKVIGGRLRSERTQRRAARVSGFPRSAAGEPDHSSGLPFGLPLSAALCLLNIWIYMLKEFDFTIPFFAFLKRYFKVYAIAFSGLIFVLFRIYTSEWNYKNEIFIGTLIGSPMILFLSSFLQYNIIWGSHMGVRSWRSVAQIRFDIVLIFS
jgi:hypothetical protein